VVLTNTIRATQAVTIRDEVLGGSNGRPSQSFTLSTIPVVPLPRSEQVAGADGRMVTITDLRLEVSERPVIGVDQGFQVWQQVDDFLASDGSDPHYILNRTTGEITFGDGIHGRIPVANPSNPAGSIVAREYRAGGGRRGNVGAGTITEIQSFVAQVDSVTNLYSAAGGSDEETVDEAKARAPSALKSRGRAVTGEDFEYLATQTPGVRVRRAKALPLHHPSFPGVQIPGVVTVIAVPDSAEPNPTPSQRTLDAVCACLNQSRLLTTEVCVIPPTYRLVEVKASLIVRPQDDLLAVKTAVEQTLTEYFHPLVGGDEGLGWPFGETIFYSNVYQAILQTPGVDRIDNNQLEIYLDNEVQPFCRDVPLDEGDLLYSEGHEISVKYATR
jgi:predicted phage baseplate assembly protein